MNIAKGVKLLDEKEGAGLTAARGDKVVFNWRLYLNRGDEVPLNEIQIKSLPGRMKHLVRTEDGHNFLDHTADLGKRETVAAVRHSLTGMREGGYRKVKASPHLAFGEKGLPELIPENAVLIIELWLREVLKTRGS